MAEQDRPSGAGRSIFLFERTGEMHTVVIVIHLMLVMAMIGVVMLQKSEGGGLGIGSTGGFMTSRGTANVLTRATAFLAGGFFITSVVLSIIASHERKPTAVIPAPASQSGAPAVPGPAAPAQGGGVLDKLQAPAAPAAPTGPQVPPSK
jgi:preprotein translocase subunit SecG